jgi:hypothetical protein
MDKDALGKEIEIELKNLNRLTGEMEDLVAGFSEEPDVVQTRAAGSILHDFYSGVEKLFERIAIHIDGELPKGEDWHAELLSRMGRFSDKISGETVIDQELLAKLKEYLRFRHLFRNIYGFQLKWKRFEGLSLSLSDILGKLKVSVDAFVEKLDEKK